MRPSRLLVVVPAAVLLAAGCGGGSTTGTGTPAAASAAPAPATGSSSTGGELAALPAAEILTRATAALKAADSVRIKGQGGEGTGRFAIDLRYTGGDSAGTLGVGGHTIELRKIGRTVYLKGGRAFWTGNGGGAAAQLLAGKWLKTPLTDQRFSGLSQLTDLDKAADGILDPDGAIEKGGTRSVNGVPAIGLTSKGKGAGTLFVATTGEPYPLRIEPAAGSGEKGALDFGKYGEQATVRPPPTDQVVDVSKLPGN